ncbi:MAG: lasso peptide biosynthesis B2 protein [Halioglobus sp.]
MNRLAKFWELAPRHKVLLVKAWLLLGCYRFAILTLSFKRLTAHLEHHRIASTPHRLPSNQRDEAKLIGHLVAGASRVTPWQSLCLVQVLVVQRLLASRDIPGQFFLGVRMGVSDDQRDKRALAAHAWLQCDEDIVNGAAGHEQFAVVSAFSWGRADD